MMKTYFTLIIMAFVITNTKAQTFKNSYSMQGGPMFSDFPVGYYFQNTYTREHKNFNYWIKFGIAAVPGNKNSNSEFEQLSYANYTNLNIGASLIPINRNKFRLSLAAGVSGRYYSEFCPIYIFYNDEKPLIGAWDANRGFDLGFTINIIPEIAITERLWFLVDIGLSSYISGSSQQGVGQKFTGIGLNYKF